MRRIKLAFTLAGLLALSACGFDLTTPSAPPETTRGGDRDSSKAGIEEVAVQPDSAAGPKADDTRPTMARRSAAPAPVNDDPQQLIGLAPPELARRLGSPGFVRRDGAAEIWQYPAAACILDVFLYRQNDTLSVDYVELRGRGAAGVSRRECFAEMLRAQATAERG